MENECVICGGNNDLVNLYIPKNRIHLVKFDVTCKECAAAILLEVKKLRENKT